MASIIFSFDNSNILIECSKENIMRDICQKYCSKIGKDLDSLLFLYEGNPINLDLSFKEQANPININKQEVKILVRKKENNLSSNNKSLINNIKSTYYIKILFSYLDPKIKLKIIKYNKNLQNATDIKLFDYRLYSQRYIIYESKGRGKEYYTHNDLLIYRGEYLNGERNGKGILYFDNFLLKLEGEFSKGKLLNGKAYNMYGKVVDLNGFKKEYDRQGRLLFEGEFLNGIRNGKGKEHNYFTQNVIFEGEYLNGMRWNGKGYNGRNNNMVYELKKGKGHIKEYDVNDDLEFEGEYLNGKRNGKGKEYYRNKLIFEGEYLNSFRLRGKAYINEKLEFDGVYLCNKKWDGKGYDENGNIIYELKNGTGEVKEYNNEGKLIYEGEYFNGKKNGKGKEFDNGKLIFEGEYLSGERSGKGKEYNNDYHCCNLIFEGEYLKGKRNGKGKEYNYWNGKLKFEGEYLNGERKGKGK